MIDLCSEHLFLRCNWLYVLIMSRRSESTLYSCLNVRELFARSRRVMFEAPNGWVFVRDMIRTYSQLHRTDKYSEYSSIIWSIWPNDWVFVYELSGSGFKSSCSHLNLRLHAWFEQGLPWNSGNYRVWIHSETRTWHDKNIQSVYSYL